MNTPSKFGLGALALALLVSVTYDAGSAQSANQTQSAASNVRAPGATPILVAAAPAGDVAHGKTLYAANCAGCHGATGTEGGVGPSLKGEKSRKNQAAAVAWIKDPKAPMPKLYPSPLSAKDVADVAAYVESL
jgi:mono/diheme cytochrome c family protein